jgi:hypothetical protein
MDWSDSFIRKEFNCCVNFSRQGNGIDGLMNGLIDRSMD